ncbi:MAG: hypothetical protein ABIL06_12745 [Pseudomonadota bacterium]
MRYSTGRGTRIRHSTAMEWDEYEKKKRGSRIRYSTGKGAALRHACGVLLDEETAEQEIQPDRDSALVGVKKDLKEKSGKGFKGIVADYPV